MDLLLDQATNDLVIEGGDLRLTSSIVESTAQRVGIRYRTRRGEWVYDVTLGIDYDRVFAGADDRTIETFYVAEAGEVETVRAVRRVNLERFPDEIRAEVVLQAVDGETFEVIA